MSRRAILLSTANAGTTEIMARKSTKNEDDAADEKKAEATGEKKAEAGDKKAELAKPGTSEAETQPIVVRSEDPKELPEIDPPPPKGEPWPDATPEPMRPVDVRSRSETLIMPPTGDFGAPPDMPRTTAPPPLALGAIENPAHLPGPREIPSGNPEDPAPAPGVVPKGDSRSLRRGKDFALIYRLGTYVISRSGVVGTRGQWRVVEYPTSVAASHAYAKECSRFVSEGFSDYRE
jgi:hypothetical protein